MWAPHGHQLITLEELREALTCNPELGFESGSSR
jgi:hypothetical protein